MTRPEWDSNLYDDRHSFVWKSGQAVVELLNPRPGEKILDLGCGTGHLTSQIAAASADVIGIDLSQAMIDKARQNFPGITFSVQDALEMTYTSKFDAVFSNAVIHWISDQPRLVRNIRRVLKLSGRLVAEFGGKGNVQAILDGLQTTLQEMAITPPEQTSFFPSVSQYTRLLEENGFEVTEARLFDRPTLLEGATGLRDWVKMFRPNFVSVLSNSRLEEMFQRLEARLSPDLKKDGQWFADYRRLQVRALAQ